MAGLLVGPLWPAGVLLASLVALGLAGRAGIGLLAAAAVLSGAVLAEERLAVSDRDPAHALIGEAVTSRAILLEPARERPTGLRAARVELLDGPAARAVVAARIAPDAGWPVRTQVGDVIALEGRLVALARAEAYQARRGAHAALAVNAVRATETRRVGMAGRLDSVRRRAEEALAASAPPAEAQLLRGMVLGQDEGIEETVRDEFRRSGLAHLLAASGQNVMLLAILAIAAATVLGAGLRVRLFAALVLVALYVPLAGGGPSIQRAGVMGAAGLVAALAGRPASRWYAVGLAAALTLAGNPRAAGEPGWQLSFAAVIAMLVLVAPLRGWLCRRGCPAPVAEATAITLAATAGTAPLMALHFEAVSLASLPANLLAAPAVAPVMWLGMLAATVGQVSVQTAAPLSGLAAYPAAYVEWVAHVAAGFPSASVEIRAPSVVAVVLGYAAVGAAIMVIRSAATHAAPLAGRLGRAPGRVLAVGAGLAVVLAVALVVLRSAPPARGPDELVVSFFDVGQGDATLLQHRDTAILFDTGPPGGPILQRLREAGVQRLDALVLTHAEADHEGMAPAVLRAHPTRLVINGGAGARTAVQRALPGAAAMMRSRTSVPAAGQLLTLGSLRMHVLWPPATAPGAPPYDGDPNLRAMVAHVSLGAFDLLLPADAESVVTAALELPEVEALKVAHHGSADEGLPSLLERLSPQIAVVEVGESNSYGHPTPSTLAALSAVPQVMRTDRDGTVRLRVSAGRMRLEGSRS